MTRKMDVVSGLVAAWALSGVPAHTHAHAFSLQQLHERSPSPEPKPDRKGDDDDDDDDDSENDQSNNVDYITQSGNPHFPVPGTAITMTSSLSFFNPTPSIPITAEPTSTDTNTFLVFETIQNTTVCGEDSISWEYAGDQTFTLALGVTNDGVEGVDPSAQVITQVLEVDTHGLNSSNTYKWSPVALPVGPYVAVASIPDVDMLFFSPTFYVFNSSDHSCLSNNPSTSSSLAGSSSTTAVSSTSQSSTGTALPVEGAVSKGLSGGGIAGVVIGILALVGLGGALLVLLRRCRSRTVASSALFGRSRRMSGYIEKRDPPSPGHGAGGIGGFPGVVGSRGRSRGVSVGGAGTGVNRGFGGGSSDFAVHNIHGSSSQEEIASLADQEKEVENARPSTIASDADVLGVLSLHSFPPNTYRDSSTSGQVARRGVSGREQGALGLSRSSSYSARSVASDPFDSDGGVMPRSSPGPSPIPSDRLSLAPSVSDPFNPFASPADLEQNRAQVGSRERQVPVQLFMPTSATSSPRPGIPRDISTSSMAESETDTYMYDPESDNLSEGATTATGGTIIPPARRMPPSAPAMSAGRRTMSSRKPVPVYAPSVSGEALELTEPSTPRSAYYQHSSYSSTHSGSGNSGNDWSSAAAHSHSPATASPMSSGSHLPHSAGNRKRDSNSLSISGSTSSASASASRSMSVIGGASTISPSSPTSLGSPSTVVNGHASFLSGHQYLPELNHKSSFGDRPVHYLIPDPPSENVL